MSNTVSESIGNDTLGMAQALLARVSERASQLLTEVQSHPADRAIVTAVFGAASAAAANLSAENIGELANAIRQRRLPRRKGA